MIREIAYDEVFHAQEHFRSLLDAMARPGKINVLAPVAIAPPSGLNQGSVLVALALLNAESSFHLVGMTENEAAYLKANSCAPSVSVEQAGFIFLCGESAPEALDGIHCGTLDYPDTAATLVIQVEAISAAPLAGALRFDLKGPGVDGCATVFIKGVNPSLLLAIQARNAEFPLGVDSIFTSVSPNGKPAVVALPRTTTVSWKVEA